MISFRSALEVPRRLRALARARESTIVVLAAVVGLVAGLAVAAMSAVVSLLHHLLFNVPWGEHLSTLPDLDWRIALAVPSLGGLGFGLATFAVERWRKRREIDPIEANALHGGRMSMTGSTIVALQTIWSSGVGASVGLEAGYTQAGAPGARSSARPSGCAGPTCACWSAAARRAPSPPPSPPRSPAPSTPSS